MGKWRRLPDEATGVASGGDKDMLAWRSLSQREATCLRCFVAGDAAFEAQQVQRVGQNRTEYDADRETALEGGAKAVGSKGRAGCR